MTPKTNLACKDCEGNKKILNLENNINILLDKKVDSYLRKTTPELIFSFNFDGMDKISKGKTKELKPTYEKHKGSIPHNKNMYKLTLRHRGDGLVGNHISMFLNEEILNSLKKNILLIPDERLQTYKQKKFEDHIASKDFTTAKYQKWTGNLKELVDSNVIDNKAARLVRSYNGEAFTTTIAEQGSGVRSIVCLLADIMDENDQKVILLDEPELGLNPFAKQSLLDYLLVLSKNKQIFITTQDPTFINPIIWRDRNVGLYLYSSYGHKFVKPDVQQCKDNPDTFAGFLPHTVSLKKIHLYLEGPSDVYIFQILLRKFLQQKYNEYERKSDGGRIRLRFHMERIGETWIEAFNKIGMYHLCGDFWEHLLYTIPNEPYKCIIILDGDKRTKIQAIIDNHNKAMINKAYLKVCKNLKGLRKTFHAQNAHPVYCLKKDCIEKYLLKRFNPQKPPKDYNKNYRTSIYYSFFSIL